MRPTQIRVLKMKKGFRKIFCLLLAVSIASMINSCVIRSDEKLAIILINEKYGCINQKGKLVIPAIYDRIGMWSEGLASVMLNEKVGFIDVKGNQVIPLDYYVDCDWGEMPFFSEGLTAMNLNGAWGFIDRTGKEVIPFYYQEAGQFQEGLAPVMNQGKWGFVNKIGKQVIGCKYKEITSFHNGFAVGKYISFIRQMDRWQIIDTTGREISEIYNRKYYYIGSFSEGLAPILIKQNCFDYDYGDVYKYGFIDTTGNVVVPIQYDYYLEGDAVFHTCFYEGLTKVSKGKYEFLKYGFIDKTGREVTPLKYDNASDFNEGLAAVLLNEKLGFINQNGEEVIPFIYDGVYTESGIEMFAGFREGLIAVEKDEKWGFIDRTGKIIIPFKYDFANNFYEGLAYTSEGFIDKRGRVCIPMRLLQRYTNAPLDSYSIENFVNVKNENKNIY